MTAFSDAFAVFILFKLYVALFIKLNLSPEQNAEHRILIELIKDFLFSFSRNLIE